jgi:hypothetical protein
VEEHDEPSNEEEEHPAKRIRTSKARPCSPHWCHLSPLLQKPVAAKPLKARRRFMISDEDDDDDDGSNDDNGLEQESAPKRRAYKRGTSVPTACIVAEEHEDNTGQTEALHVNSHLRQTPFTVVPPPPAKYSRPG